MFSNNTVVGPSILISGRLSGDEDLTVRGRVEGEIVLSHTLIVEESGIVKANVEVKHAIVSGVVVGNIRATECVELTPGGRMVGDIVSPRVMIVDGASFRGRVDMGEAQGPREAQERPATKPSYTAYAPRFSSALRPPSVPRPPLRSASPPAPLQRPAAPRPMPVQRTVVTAPPPAVASPPEHLPSDADEDSADAKPLPPEPPVLMDVNKKKVVVKKKK
ncbi:MAG: polymer-forming cytoskeletal protein [Cystobacterineae bacterium]|nr:polymer-forming cytoskeletal protein [Cystobacterineae bacterium]